jgi:hypothetical protein
MLKILNTIKTSELTKKTLIFFAIGLISFINLQIYSEFDYRADSGWRNTDISAQTQNYISGKPFSEPTVNVSRNKFGVAFLETSLPILPYFASKITHFFDDGISNPLGFEVDKKHFIDFGPFKMQNNIPHASLMNFTKSEFNIDGGKKTVVVFEKYKGLIAKIFDLGENGNKFYAAMDYQDCGVKFKFLLDEKSITPNCSFNTDDLGIDSKNESKGRQVNFTTYVWDGKHKLEFISYDDQPLLNSPLKLYSLSVPGNAVEKANRAVLAFFITISLFLVYLTFDYFAPKRYIFNFLLSQTLTPFYFFFGKFHEEPIAFSLAFGAALLWTIYKNKNLEGELLTLRDIVGFAMLGIAISLRLYYGIFILFLIFDRIHLILKIRSISSFLELVNKNYKKAVVSIFMIFAPAIMWFSHTQYRTSKGADSIDIFSSRVFLDSLFNPYKWEQILTKILTWHISYLALFGLSILIFTRIFSKTKMSRMNVVFVSSLSMISIIIFPLIFDSSAHHDYYVFPSTVAILLAIVIYSLEYDNSSLSIKSRLWFYKKPLYLGSFLRKIAVILLLTSTLLTVSSFLTRSFVLSGDNYDFYVGARYHSVVDRLNTVQPFFIFDSGPQGYHLAGHSGYRPLDIAGAPTYFDDEDKQFFLDSIENSVMGSVNYKVVYWCEQSRGDYDFNKDGIVTPHPTNTWAKEYYSGMGWEKFYLDNSCFFYAEPK